MDDSEPVTPKPLIELQTAKLHLKVSGDAEDVLIGIYLDAALISAMKYMGRSVFADQAALDVATEAGTAGEKPLVIDGLIIAAVLLMLGHLYINREDTVTKVTATELPLGSRALLYPLRTELGI